MTHPLGAELRRLRRERGVTQHTLASVTGLSQSTISTLENAATAHLDALHSYLTGLGVPHNQWPDVLALRAAAEVSDD